MEDAVISDEIKENERLQCWYTCSLASCGWFSYGAVFYLLVKQLNIMKYNEIKCYVKIKYFYLPKIKL
jgi:hypothetical protein